MFNRNTGNRMDTIGVGVSLLCAIHCALLPIFITLLPLFGLGFLANNYFEGIIIATSMFVGYTSLTTSHRKHKHTWPLVILTTGFVLIFTGKILVEPHREWLFLTTGGLLVASAHFYNSKLSSHVHKKH